MKGKFDIVVCYQSLNNIAGLILWQLRKILGYKFIWWGIGFDPYRQENPKTTPKGFLKRVSIFLKDLCAFF